MSKIGSLAAEKVSCVMLESSFLNRFGEIMHYYASAEFGIKSTICGIIDIHPFHGFILLEPVGTQGVRNIAKCFSSDTNLEPEEKITFKKIIDDFGNYGPIRNAIAHCIWKEGIRPNSIRPIGMKISSGSPKMTGFGTSERDYTPSDLSRVSADLFKLNRRIIDFRERTGISERQRSLIPR